MNTITVKTGAAAIVSTLLLALSGCLSTSSLDALVSASAEEYGPYPQSVKPDNFNPGYYLSVGHKDSIFAFRRIADNPDFVGVKKRYRWSDIEKRKGVYDFSEIEQDLDYLESIGKQLWITITNTSWDSRFRPIVPRYMLNDSRYGCGKNGRYYGVFERSSQKGGWLPCRGNPEFDKRYKALLAALGKRFNKEPSFEGINLGETSTGKNPNFRNANDKLKVFKEYALAAKEAFPDKVVMQMINYANFDLEAFADWLASNGIATGGPDVHLTKSRRGSILDVYALHKKNNMLTPNGIDVQWDNWEYWGDTYTSRELLEGAVEHINPWYIFWIMRDPYFKDVVKTVREYGELPLVKDFWPATSD